MSNTRSSMDACPRLIRMRSEASIGGEFLNRLTEREIQCRDQKPGSAKRSNTAYGLKPLR